ncbi:MAG: hypothetical protein WBB85_21890 [Albidovulum sp.]|uniref:hypothetical protein n=1 Tax=Albidovulum sp. TaxID=1872424 RepID=UPI003CB208AC
MLGIMALVLLASVRAFRPPSPAFRLQELIAEKSAEAARAQVRAVRNARAVVVEVNDATCSGAPVPLTFFPDGTASAANICLRIGEQQTTLTLDPLTGQLRSDAE